ncbi:hypothetical protein ACFLSS_01515 [Bacteroidota bacterium]
MNNGNAKEQNVFEYNMSFYYQSTIIYFVVLVLYLIIRGEFVDGSFTLVTRDPILYFLGLIVIFSLFALLYNKLLNKHIEVKKDGIAFINRFKERRIEKENIVYIKLFRQRGSDKSKKLRIARIKIEDRIRPIMFRLTDYENENLFYEKILELKSETEKN